MVRSEMLRRIEQADAPWEVLIVGGGATGLGCAVEAAARGYRTLLLEQHDFAKGTSSRSTKLVHGGVRYLQQGNVALVREALRERGRLYRNAPHLVHNLPFLIPNYAWWEGPFYGFGLKLYDLLAGRLGLGASRRLSHAEALTRLPTLEPAGLNGGILYHDGQFDDARLALCLARTAANLGATLLNYCPVTGLTKTQGRIDGVTATDAETGQTWTLPARVVINATGVFCDAVRRMDEGTARPLVQPSQGIHLVLDRTFLPGETALMVPRTDDGRVLFAIPWHGRVVVGTTDTPVATAALEPRALPEEIDFLLAHAGRYLTRDPTPADVRSVFAGLRPLVARQPGTTTASLSRDHLLQASASGLLTITGGKWTTWRKMAEDTLDQAMLRAGLPRRPSATPHLPLHGWHDHAEQFGPLAGYGADAPAVQALLNTVPDGTALLHPRLPYLRGEVAWAVRHEMARTVEDVLARRLRALLLDARASVEAAPVVARLMAPALGQDEGWVRQQVSAYETLAAGYLLEA
jgi:glycerol-3-phosphate dehydrogenase